MNDNNCLLAGVKSRAKRRINRKRQIQNPSMGWALPGFYLLGREWLISLGLIRPQDALAKSGLPAAMLQPEITESTVMQNRDQKSCQ